VACLRLKLLTKHAPGQNKLPAELIANFFTRTPRKTASCFRFHIAT
jgi:hypothetical protein